jgi:hypothetical protein
MHSLSFDSSFLNNSVFILDGLKSSDYQSATHLNDELLDLALEGVTPYCKRLVTRSRADLFSALVQIRDLCREGVKPRHVGLEAEHGAARGLLAACSRPRPPVENWMIMPGLSILVGRTWHQVRPDQNEQFRR